MAFKKKENKMDKLDKIYEKIMNEEKEKIVDKNPTIIDKMNERLDAIEESIRKLVESK
jgi:hypothetical protein